MAAYAALVSLLNITEQIKTHPHISTCFHKKQIESVGEKVFFLLDFVESFHSHERSKEAEELGMQIASTAQEAEDVIESHVVDQIISESSGESTTELLDLSTVIKAVVSIEMKVMEAKEKYGSLKEHASSTPAPTRSKPVTSTKHAVVGFDDELIQLMDMLTGQQSSREVISITGMGGMGKTTLARSAYENLLIKQSFDVRAWATISQEYSELEILLQLLSLQQKSTDDTVEKLGEKLYKNLWGRRYLIVLDDMWSIEVWDKLKFFLPDNGNGSRVVVTTRLSKVGDYCGSSYFRMNFLKEDISWILFHDIVFGKEGSCPLNLEKIGRKIVRKCRELPLSITVIGGLLQKSSRTTGYWKSIAENLSSNLNSGEENCLNILSLSYIHLPAHLKPCFLCMSSFPEDSVISVSQIVQLWVAEGFIKPNGAQMLEDIAQGYLEDLVDRNLFLVGGRRHNGSIKSCRVHDLIRELCLKICEKEKFCCMMNELDAPQSIQMERRLILHDHISKEHNSRLLRALQPASLARSLVCKSVEEAPIKLKLLRVWIKAENCSSESIFQNFNLRFLSIKLWNVTMFKIPSSMSLFWNLQTLVLKHDHYNLKPVAVEIWNMPQLRHVVCDEIRLSDPPQTSKEQENRVVLTNLQTISLPVNFRWSEEVGKRIPNIRKLSLLYECIVDGHDSRLRYQLHNLCGLRKLVSLNIQFPEVQPHELPVRYSRTDYASKENLRLPYSLKKLSISNSHLQWQDLTILVGSLPHLEALKLDSVLGQRWSLINGQFPRLKFLQLYNCDLASWNADNSHFPVLEKLVLRNLRELEEIPSDIGEIMTLEVINVDLSSKSAAVSAVRIKNEQVDMGNEDLQLHIVADGGRSIASFREMVETEGLAIDGVQFYDKDY